MDEEKIKESICTGCGREIGWIKTVHGKDMPVDLRKVTIVTKEGETKRGFIPHWSTCEKANEFKKK